MGIFVKLRLFGWFGFENIFFLLLGILNILEKISIVVDLSLMMLIEYDEYYYE